MFRSVAAAVKAVALSATALSAVFTAALVAPAKARITEIRIDAVEPFAEGQPFGEAGSYERVTGTAKGELDPQSPQNQTIVDIDKAPRNARGLVEYETDFFMLRPLDPNRGNGVIFYEVNNRGRKALLARVDEAPPDNNDPRTILDAGLGFSLGRGYTIVWSGWDPDAPTANGGLTAHFPVATDDGKPIVRRIREEFEFGTRSKASPDLAKLYYPSATLDTSTARLTVRERESDARIEIPATGWSFQNSRAIRLTPAGKKFEPVAIYELWYDATAPKVVGMGFAATRDFVSFLRYDRADPKGTANPAMGGGGDSARPHHALAFGISQSGRFVRSFIELGMNKDESGRRVFDGALAHTAGAGKVFANTAFAEPTRTATQHEDRLYPENWFPFSAAGETDPASGRTGSLFRGDGSDPVLISTNTSTEYWQKGASLIHIDSEGKTDLTLPPNSRVYLIAGTQHGGAAGLSTAPGACANMKNPHNPSPVLRALIVALEDWVVKGIAPPPSRVPTIAQGTAVSAASAAMPAVKGVALPQGDNPITEPVDWVNPPEGDGRARDGRAVFRYETRVPAVDADGNETAGIRLPPIAVPLATYTGWNVYRAQPTELCDRNGTYAPFARTRAEREASGDPRLSVAERYGSRAAYVAKVKAAADALVGERLLLPADAARYVREAERSDRF
jgi:Alpha/beta hydrolase domain